MTLATRAAGDYLSRNALAEPARPRWNRGTPLRLIGFIVLAAIVLSTGFAALAAPDPSAFPVQGPARTAAGAF